MQIHADRFLCIIFIGLFSLANLNATAQHTRLSEEASVSVLIYGPWQKELYSAFGHSAFRVYDPVNKIDEAYDYGVFDFDQPNFYMNFAKGYLYYKLGVHDYQLYKNYYIYHNRYIHEQVLNLTHQQVQKLYDTLQWNALPENENYRYDYFYNNCASKLPEVVKNVLKDAVIFDSTYIKTDYSIRELTDLYLDDQPWGDIGIDICLGLDIDKVASPYEYMFLPEYIEKGFDNAYIVHGTDTSTLVKEKITVYASRDEAPPEGLPHPMMIFGVIAFLGMVLSILDFIRGKISAWFDFILFSITGLIGLLLLFLWFFTDHYSSYNFNLLWALPTHIFIVFVLLKKKNWIRKYFLVAMILQALLLMFWPFLPQKLNHSLTPIVILLGIRCLVQFFIRSKILKR